MPGASGGIGNVGTKGIRLVVTGLGQGFGGGSVLKKGPDVDGYRRERTAFWERSIKVIFSDNKGDYLTGSLHQELIRFILQGKINKAQLSEKTKRPFILSSL